MKNNTVNRKLIKPMDFIIIALVVISSVWLLTSMTNANSSGLTAVIKQNGAIIKEIPLFSINEPYNIVVDGKIKVTVHLEHDGVSIIDSECIDHVCVNTGKITKKSMAVICLPAKVSVELTNSDSKSEIDAVVG